MELKPLDERRFLLGCNYWSSRDGLYMWRRWNADVVAGDFDTLAAHNIDILRVFPLWPDFQPIEPFFGGGGDLVEMRMNGQPLPDTEDGRAGLAPVMLDRFENLLRMAEERNIKLIVPLITGWMSGQLFVPPALANLNHITDSRSVHWQVRMVKRLVQRFKGSSAIIAWELGNECNCMSGVVSSEDAWKWAQTISDAIRAEDSTRPVLSGMWTLLDGTDKWKVEDIAECSDVLTAHTYPCWMPLVEGWCLSDIRQRLNSTIASVMYSDIGRRPCITEEIGSLGPMNGHDGKQADHLRSNMWSLWQHNNFGCLWWSSHDYTEVDGSPYDTYAIEPELGLFRADNTPKETALEMQIFKKMLDILPQEIALLPPRKTDAVCILPSDGDRWTVGMAAFILAKQAGFDLKFSPANRPIPDAMLYIIPCLSGTAGLPAQRWAEIKQKVSAGAQLYLSLSNGALTGFSDLFGCRIVSRGNIDKPVSLRSETISNIVMPHSKRCFSYEVEAGNAEVIATDDCGCPLFTEAKYGKGKAFCLFHGLEAGIAMDGNLSRCGNDSPAAIYRMISAGVIKDRMLQKKCPDMVLITEHAIENGVVAVLSNPNNFSVNASYGLHESVKAVDVIVGNAVVGSGEVTVDIAPGSGAVIVCRM